MRGKTRRELDATLSWRVEKWREIGEKAHGVRDQHQ
jgi:hypothetical protein